MDEDPCITLSDPGNGSNGATEFIFFKPSTIHGTGGFARTNIPAGTRVIEYLGVKIDKRESLRRCEQNNEYIFALDAEFDLDGNVDWNPARFINHSCSPNCEAEQSENRIWIVAVHPIQAGEEITFNYGYDLEDYREYPCCCGSPECAGFMLAEEFFEQIRKPQKPKLST
jgi:uncharacterized protein